MSSRRVDVKSVLNRAGLAMALLLLGSFSLAATELFSQLPPDTSDVRRQVRDIAFASLDLLWKADAVVHRSRNSGERARFSVESNRDYMYALVAPERNGAYPVDTAGTYVLRRDRRNGSVSQIKIFLRSHPGFFARVRPVSGESSEMSVVLAGVEIHRRVPVPLAIERVFELPLDELFSVTSRQVDWARFYPETSDRRHQITRLVTERARASLHTLPDAEDGAMNERGELVRIETLALADQEPGFNCSGFAKWIVDGLYGGRYGSFLPIEPLKEKHLEYRGNEQTRRYEELRDPFFGLDWTRNLAVAVRHEPGRAWEGSPEQADVRSVRYVDYLEDFGYPVSHLPLVLFELAALEPGHAYLASFSRDFGSNPTLQQHVHVAVLFPYFDSAGRFRTVVMERNVETSLASVDRRYRDAFVHLVRVELSESFTPPVIHY
ncbi:MAG: hypothetical protein ACLFNT_13180 [Spirochaetales bacterium]